VAWRTWSASLVHLWSCSGPRAAHVRASDAGRVEPLLRPSRRLRRDRRDDCGASLVGRPSPCCHRAVTAPRAWSVRFRVGHPRVDAGESLIPGAATGQFVVEREPLRRRLTLAPHRTLRDVATVTVPPHVGQGTLLRVSERIREVLGEVDHPCHSCGYGCAVAVETRPVKRFRDRFRNDPDRRVRRFETCLDCGATVRVRPEKSGGVGGGNGRGPGYLAQ
jgi:NAD-dependent dihydropyrimidine dehydrogenase PreA subunit